jgi:hypothetical protein
MEIIKCITCNTPETEWVHGAYPDQGGFEAHDHKMRHPDHAVLTGDTKQLEAMARQRKED